MLLPYDPLLGYNAFLISTLVDVAFAPIASKGYNAFSISTLVDMPFYLQAKFRGYNAFSISTLVD